jgi:hypothetical protein
MPDLSALPWGLIALTFFLAWLCGFLAGLIAPGALNGVKVSAAFWQGVRWGFVALALAATIHLWI